MRPPSPRSPGAEGDVRDTLLLAVVALSVFVVVGALSLRQLASPAFALPALEAGIASLTDIDRYLGEELPGLRAELGDSGDAAAPLPGFPVTVLVTADDISTGTEELRQLVLERAAARVYREGTGAFDRTGDQSVSLFSSEYVLKLLVDRMNAGLHELAGKVALGASLLLAASAVATTLRQRRFAPVLGAAVVVGALPGLAVASLAWLSVAQYGGGDDVYAAEVRSVLRAAISLPLRNFAIAAGAGVLIVAAVLVAEIFARDRPSGRHAAEAMPMPGEAPGETAEGS